MEAMSGDETDHHNGKNRYIITSLPWRARWISQWMRIFDRLHLATRFQRSGRATPGAFPHIRVQYEERVDRSCIDPARRLPRNFYDPEWLRLQDPHYVRWLDIQPEIDLELPVELLRSDLLFDSIFALSLYLTFICRIAATCRNVTSHNTRPVSLESVEVIPGYMNQHSGSVLIQKRKHKSSRSSRRQR